MSIWVAMFLGIIQGLTEFLPISSSGHLVLFEKIFGISYNTILFDVILHLGTLCAVVFYYRKKIFKLLKNPISLNVQMLGFATFPTLLIAILFKDLFVESFNGGTLALGFFVTAIFLIIAEIVSKKYYQYKDMSFSKAFIVGVFQGVAILPGISRSGSTITSAIVQGVKRSEAVEFSFLLSIPIILASAVFEGIETIGTPITISSGCIILGFLFALFSGFFAIKLMNWVVKKAKYSYFAIYLILLSGFLILNNYVFNWF